MACDSLERAIERFLYWEAYLLDHRRYREWLGLFAEDATYAVLMRSTVERRAGLGVEDDAFLLRDTRPSLAVRVERLYTKSAWVEEPPPRQRHFVTNVMVELTGRQNEYLVRSYVLVLRSRACRGLDRRWGSPTRPAGPRPAPCHQ
ncbi:Biphenyl 2,3-dioxygenase subunit beta [bacterium HR24]|nr:Biphenyl 2,3-dioxygenase subunit beta [bacterium HR24]